MSDSAFAARTDGPDGTLGDYEIKYTFGTAPLQQYLVAAYSPYVDRPVEGGNEADGPLSAPGPRG